MKKLDKITPMEQDFAKWYQDVVKQGNLIAYGALQGSMAFKPISFGIWENIQTELNKIFRKNEVQNVYLPLLIPSSYIEREKDHVKGFAPELATVTRVGNKELEESLVIRPTSEVLFGELFSNEIRSYKNLPIKYNQWANVIRWEKKTNPFLRNREFLWQEGHTVHSTSEEARKITRKMIKIYAKFLKDFLAIPVIVGKKTPKEKFAGAVTTYTIEAMMKDGRALQSGTSHYLGQNFAKAFDIEFVNKDNKKEYAYQTSWGVSTRLIGALIMSHSDNRGIIIPPKIAPNQIDILELFGNKNESVKLEARRLKKVLSRKYRVRLDDSSKGPGFKAGKSEIEGTPLRIEVGPRDLENEKVTIVRRDTLEKIQVNTSEVPKHVATILKDIHNDLYKSARDRLDNNIVNAKDYSEFKELINNRKFVAVPFAGNSKDEEKIKKETGASTRCIPFDIGLPGRQECFFTGKETKRLVIFARAY
ncbi:MAG: proline--tRNA ligase [Mycoplasmataceae bacterium]|nr:proline--tRNA ligase [Mycoplasmataceae bacterium]